MNNRLSLLAQRWGWLVGLVVIGAMVLLLVLRPDVRTTLNTNQGAISAVLTAMLVLLYFGQYRLQNTQLRLEHAAPVQIQKYDTEGRYLEVWLSNPGNGPATNIGVKGCIEFTGADEFESGCATTRLRRVDEDGDYRKRVGNSLQAGEHLVRFRGDPKVGITVNEDSDGWGLLAATDRLASTDIEEITLDFRVTSEDLLGNQYEETVFGWPYTVSLDEGGVDIHQATTRGQPAIEWKGGDPPVED